VTRRPPTLGQLAAGRWCGAVVLALVTASATIAQLLS